MKIICPKCNNALHEPEKLKYDTWWCNDCNKFLILKNPVEEKKVNDNYHVFPVNDLKEHNTDSTECDCNPVLEKQENGSFIIVHRSWDRRENDEPDAITKELVN